MVSSEKEKEVFSTAGTQTDTIDLKISHKIIELFSEGLYSSPNKAIEELVSNSYDAGASNTHVILSTDLRDSDATIVVVDDGEGMDVAGLKRHWIIGQSTRRREAGSTRRKPIGKFGIGKLSTFVLASKLTHISKSGDTYYAATMDYSVLTSTGDKTADAVFDERTVNIPLRTLTKDEALQAVEPWITGEGPGYEAFDLFGEDAPESWTVAIMSNLKPLGQKVKMGRLRWVLRTAMPIFSTFNLFLDGEEITPPEIETPLAHLTIGKEIIQMPKPSPDGFIAREDKKLPKDSLHRFGVYHDKLLGRITGYIEVFENELDAGKDKFERSNGFFVYVHDRRVNEDDPGFGIERNLLRHGTFSRFRMVVYIDSLDEALRSSRESFQQGELYESVQNFLRAGFNLARNRLVEHDRTKTPGALISARLSSAPGSMTRKPLLSLAQLVADNKATPFYVRFPHGLSGDDKAEFLEDFQQRVQASEGLVGEIELAALDAKEGLAVFDLESRKLQVNSNHPFVAAFQEVFANPQKSLPLEIFAMTEILMEAHLYEMGIEESMIRDILARRDELLRQMVRSTARRTAGMIALALTEARNDQDRLEEEMRAAFEALGFDNVIRIGGSNNPDGTAEAYLSADDGGGARRYKVGLEAKSGAYVTAKELGVSGLARHTEDHQCDHHLVIGNKFATTRDELSASVREIRNHKKNEGKTITLMYIDDLARLIRIINSKRVGGLSKIRELLTTCITPERSKRWVDDLAEVSAQSWPYKSILDTIWQIAQETPNEPVEYVAVTTLLRHKLSITLTKSELIECCKAMELMAPGLIAARANAVEVDIRPDIIMQHISTELENNSKSETRTLQI